MQRYKCSLMSWGDLDRALAHCDNEQILWFNCVCAVLYDHLKRLAAVPDRHSSALIIVGALMH